MFSSHQESPFCPPENRPSGARIIQASFTFHSDNPWYSIPYSSFNFPFQWLLRLSLPPSLFCFCSKPSIPSKPYKPSLFPVFLLFFGIVVVAWEGLGMECMEWMQLQKKKQGQTNFFEIHLTLLHIFYVLFHLDTWMSLGGTRTKSLESIQSVTLL